MLKHLTIHNFAIIDSLSLDFHQGFTVLTGETGAGKSILIDAISLLLGDRASTEMIRSGKEAATVEAIFTYESSDISAKLTKLGIATLDNELVIHRTISLSNKNAIKINNQSVSLQDLKDITKHLADIHSQFDTQRLINPQTYIDLIDGFLKQKMDKVVEEYKVELSIYHQKYKEMNELIKKKNDLLQKLEMYQFQLKELNSLDLQNVNMDELKNEELSLQNFDQIYSLLQEAKSLLDDSEMMNLFFDFKELLIKISRFQSEFKEQSTKIDEYYYEIDDVRRDLSKQLDKMSFDPAYLEDLQERINHLEKIEKKYAMSIPELIEYQAFIEKEIDQSVNYDEYLEKANQSLLIAFNNTIEKAKAITLLRRQVASKITKEIKNVLEDLVLPKTEFEIEVSENLPNSVNDSQMFLSSGCNQIEFMISTNVGEPLKPLSKTASGGEMSRIMLAFKTIFIRSQNLSTMIFDEIDTGISGFVAKKIAKKMKEISEYAQVLSITHIPQVVAFGDHHLKVEKKTVSSRTIASTKYLEYSERVNEIAAMLSGDKITSFAIENAKELLVEIE
ncbi:MAG: DNA repair protein RecN [Candidatus Izemoplasmatales bacterium]